MQMLRELIASFYDPCGPQECPKCPVGMLYENAVFSALTYQVG